MSQMPPDPVSPGSPVPPPMPPAYPAAAPPPYGSTPAGMGGDFGAAQPKGWPKVVGIISIVWGSLGLLCNTCGIIGIAGQSMMVNMMPGAQGGEGQQQIPPLPDVMQPGIADYAGAALGFALSVLLIIAGSALVARKPVSRQLHLAYAGLAVVVTLVATVLAIQKQGAVQSWAQQNPDNFWAQQQNQAGAFAYMGLVFGAILGLAYPIFLLVWFGLVKRNTKEITEGVEPTI